MSNMETEREIDKNDEIQETAYEAGYEAGRKTLLNQPANQHDNEIRKDLISQLIKELPEVVEIQKLKFGKDYDPFFNTVVMGKNLYKAEVIQLLKSKLTF